MTTSYTGAVTIGGPPHVRTLDGLGVTKIAVGPMDNNAYVLRCRSTGSTVLIDAAHDAATLLRTIGARPLDTIITTHRHPDHWHALGEVVRVTGASTAAGRPDAAAIGIATDTMLDDGDEIWFGECRLDVIRLTGHTPGSVALLYRDPGGSSHLFTGDSLFPGGVGKTLTPADFSALINDVETKLFDRLPDETWVYPGHGNDTTLGAERPSLAEWRARGW